MNIAIGILAAALVFAVTVIVLVAVDRDRFKKTAYVGLDMNADLTATVERLTDALIDSVDMCRQLQTRYLTWTPR